MAVSEDLRQRIHEANVEAHRLEAGYYELLHPEVYGKSEQKRLDRVLMMVDRLVTGRGKKALDFGAGTGNLTGRLLRMGYSVIAIDISAEMCVILKKRFSAYLKSGKLLVLNSPIEDASFAAAEFDLITCYSVLHHLPDYTSTLRELSVFLKKGGAMYLDHEPSPFYWKSEPKSLAHIVKSMYLHSNPIINALYFQIIGASIPSIDYALSDYWHKKAHPLDHEEIERLFEKERFALFKRVDYHLSGTWVLNPLFYLYKRICRPEMSFWVAKK
ncbi:class I SAM-dependent methyltransferase [Candidatus Bathyarchaeota archaeon]|nr:class I SAM-dependent methyltransferase [Candidatus Bathyarchaeota archaeon]